VKKRKFTCGEIEFEMNGKPISDTGAGRISRLRAFYQGEMSEGLEAVVMNPRRVLTWREVDWDTCGSRIVNPIGDGQVDFYDSKGKACMFRTVKKDEGVQPVLTTAHTFDPYLEWIHEKP